MHSPVFVNTILTQSWATSPALMHGNIWELFVQVRAVSPYCTCVAFILDRTVSESNFERSEQFVYFVKQLRAEIMYQGVAARDTERTKCPLAFAGFAIPEGFDLPRNVLDGGMTTKEFVFWKRLFRLPLFQQMSPKDRWGWTMGTMRAYRPHIAEAVEADIETYDAVRISNEKPNDFHFFFFPSDPDEVVLALVDTLMEKCYPLTEDGLERYPLADSYLSGRDLFVPELGAEANSVRYVLQRKFGFIPVLSNKRHALLHFLTQPGDAEQVEELQSLVNECWTVSLMELD